MVQENHTCRRKTRFLSSTIHKINSKLIKDVKIKPEAENTIGKEIRETLQAVGIVIDSLEKTHRK